MSCIRLDGCTSEPLLSYLSGLGLLAAVSEQFEPEAAAWWHQGRLHLDLPAALDLDDLVGFLARAYAPLPIISPWNSRGGFRLDRQQASEKRLAQLEQSSDPRLEPYRRAIAVGREVWAEADELGLINKGAVDNKSKAQFVRLCRGRLPDDAIQWLDAAVVLVDDDARYPDLLGGTGGNLGSGDLSSNAHEAALWITSERDAEPFVRATLLGTGGVKLHKLLVGQFHPGGAGGVNMGRSDSIVNPLTFLLALHGAALFAAGVARRLDGRREATIPFSVRVDAGTQRSLADGEQVRAELWLPEWGQPLTLPELRLLLSEGRAQWSGGQSTRSLDFARAAASLGVDRRITAFSRYLIAQRLGQSTLAVPVGRFEVGLRRGVELTDAIDKPFLNSIRGRRTTNEVHRATRFVERRMFEYVDQAEPSTGRRLLVALYELERAIGRSTSSQQGVAAPVIGLSASRWLPHLVDDSPEFQVARAIASQRDRWSRDRGRQAREVSSMAAMCRPVERDGLRQRDDEVADVLEWSGRAPVIDLSASDLRTAIRQGWRARTIRCAQHPEHLDGDLLNTSGVPVAFRYADTAPLTHVIAYGEHELDDQLLREWLKALVMLDWSTPTPREESDASAAAALTLGPAFGATAPFFSRFPVRVEDEDRNEGERNVSFHPTSAHVVAVARGDTSKAVQLGGARLRQFGIDAPTPSWVDRDAGALDAALVPIGPRDLQRAVRSASPALPDTFEPSSEEPT